MMVRFLWRVARGVLSRRVAGRLGEKQWFIAYRRVGGDGHAATDPAPLTVIAPPPGRFYADPFLFLRDGRRFIFFEDYDRSSGRAAIRYVEIDEGGRHSSPQLALKQDCHLSYPFVFEDGGAVYMVPETRGRRTVELWRATRFPDDWTLDRVLLSDVSATDATLVRHDGRLWLFVAIAVDGNRATDELFLYSSDGLQGEWEPHPMNPVVSDVRRALPAGGSSRRTATSSGRRRTAPAPTGAARLQPHRVPQPPRVPRDDRRRPRAGTRQRQPEDPLLRFGRYVRGPGRLPNAAAVLGARDIAVTHAAAVAPRRPRIARA